VKNLSRILLGLHMAIAGYCVLAGWLDTRRIGEEWMLPNFGFRVLVVLAVAFPVIALVMAAIKRRRDALIFVLGHVGLSVAQYYGLYPLTT
jgi:hypothetical protein